MSDVKLTGPQTDIDLMGHIADAKACYIEVISGSGDLKINGATETLEITATGGFWVWFSPGGGLTTLTVTTSANAVFRRYMFT